MRSQAGRPSSATGGGLDAFTACLLQAAERVRSRGVRPSRPAACALRGRGGCGPPVRAAYRVRRFLSGGSPREGARSEARAEQRLAAGGRRLPRPVARHGAPTVWAMSRPVSTCVRQRYYLSLLRPVTVLIAGIEGYLRMRWPVASKMALAWPVAWSGWRSRRRPTPG